MNTVQLIPIDQIRVLNARSRSKSKFRDISTNIAMIGLKKPITVSRRDEHGYDLVCGQGRLEAFQARGETQIPAIIVDVPLEDRYLRSLVENLARRPRTPVDMARDILVLKERGHSIGDIATKVGVSETYASDVVRLLENGEERLVDAVERGEIPISIAIQIASSDDDGLQRALHEAYNSGKLRGKELLRVRRLVEERKVRGKEMARGGRSGTQRRKGPSSQDLVRALRKETQKQEHLVKKARLCEQQLRFVTSALKGLLAESSFVTILRAESLDALPKYLADAMGDH